MLGNRGGATILTPSPFFLRTNTIGVPGVPGRLQRQYCCYITLYLEFILCDVSRVWCGLRLIRKKTHVLSMAAHKTLHSCKMFRNEEPKGNSS